MGKPRTKPHTKSPISERVRQRIGEMNTTESAVSEALGWDRTVLSTILRRVDAGGTMHDDTVVKLERFLGKSAHWIRTGEELEGVRLGSLEAWPEVSAAAAERFKLTKEALDVVAAMRVPSVPRIFDAAFVASLARAWMDAT